MIDELFIIEIIQRFNIKTLMILLSEPFNTSTFIILLLFFYKYKILDEIDIIKLLIGSFIILNIKLITKRKRPYQKSNRARNYSSKCHSSIFNKYSFMSGHTFSSTLLSLILIKKYPNEHLLYLLPLLVGSSRMYLGVHYPSDILFGLSTALLFFKLFYPSNIIVKN